MLSTVPPASNNSTFLQRLEAKQRTGSKARCHLLTHGPRAAVAARLSSLVTGWGSVAASDSWLPDGFDDVMEARLGTARQIIRDDTCRNALLNWWLVSPGGANTPNWDIASTCTVDGRPGLLLVEAKAHRDELDKEVQGKQPTPKPSVGSLRNHARIGWCMDDANIALGHATKLVWGLSRDHHYQMSNRLAWSWKLAELGVPVIVVYLGFLDATEMPVPLRSLAQWETMVKLHSSRIADPSIWETAIPTGRAPFVPLIRAYNQML